MGQTLHLKFSTIEKDHSCFFLSAMCRVYFLKISVYFVRDEMVCFHYAQFTLLHLRIVYEVVMIVFIMRDMIDVAFISDGLLMLFIYDMFLN